MRPQRIIVSGISARCMDSHNLEECTTECQFKSITFYEIQCQGYDGSNYTYRHQEKSCLHVLKPMPRFPLEYKEVQRIVYSRQQGEYRDDIFYERRIPICNTALLGRESACRSRCKRMTYCIENVHTPYPQQKSLNHSKNKIHHP